MFNELNPAYSAVFQSDYVATYEAKEQAIKPLGLRIESHLDKLGFHTHVISPYKVMKTPPWKLIDLLFALFITLSLREMTMDWYIDYDLNLWYGLGDMTHYLYTIKVMFILTHCDVYYITRLLSQYSDAGTFYYNNPHKVIIIHVCGFYRFYIIHYLEGFSIINFSTFNSIESYKHIIYDLYSYFFYHT